MFLRKILRLNGYFKPVSKMPNRISWMVFVVAELNLFFMFPLATVKSNLILHNSVSYIMSFIVEGSIIYLIYVDLKELQLSVMN